MIVNRTTTCTALYRVSLLLVLALSFGHTHVSAMPSGNSTNFLNLTAGQVGVADGLDQSQRYGIEYRWAPISRYSLIPSVGYLQAGNDADFVYTELRHDWRLAARWMLTPSFGMGAFEDGQEIQLGNRLEFRSGIEIAYRLNRGFRLGMAVFHLSNAGIADKNPGTESVVLSLSIPLYR